MADSTSDRAYSLDPVTFEVVKNALITTVDQMGEHIMRTCHSFTIYARDFSNALFDAQGRTVIHGRLDLAGHLGTQHFHVQALMEAFEGDMHPGDVFAVNDPYLGGTHFSDVRLMRPIWVDDEIVAFAQSSGHWADIGGSQPGSFDVQAKEHFGEGLRITPIRVWDRGTCRTDVVDMIAHNTRSPRDARGDLHSKASATEIAERDLHRLIGKYGLETVLTAFTEVQDYVERLTRQRFRELPDGTWHTEDYIDCDPAGEEGLIPIHIKMTISGDQVSYDLSGSHPAVGSFLNSAFGATHSAIYAGTKMILPDLPLNDGFYRAVNVDLGPEGTVVNAVWPTAVTSFACGPFEKVVNSIMELWSEIVPERALACCYNVEYLLVGGRDDRSSGRPIFMWYDWVSGGWGGRNGLDGPTSVPMFGTGLALQSMEGMERLSPVTFLTHTLIPDSGGPGTFRGGSGVDKSARLNEASDTVMSYASDRGRSICWGIDGGLPSIPQSVWLNPDSPEGRLLGVHFSGVELEPGDIFTRPSAGGGGYGDPLNRDPARVVEDVIDGYVTLGGARIDYGVVIIEEDAAELKYLVDEEATTALRESIASERRKWLAEDAEAVAARYKDGELTAVDLVRRYGVLCDWSTGELLPRSTRQYRAMLNRRTVASWAGGAETQETVESTAR